MIIDANSDRHELEVASKEDLIALIVDLRDALENTRARSYERGDEDGYERGLDEGRQEGRKEEREAKQMEIDDCLRLIQDLKVQVDDLTTQLNSNE